MYKVYKKKNYIGKVIERGKNCSVLSDQFSNCTQNNVTAQHLSWTVGSKNNNFILPRAYHYFKIYLYWINQSPSALTHLCFPSSPRATVC